MAKNYSYLFKIVDSAIEAEVNGDEPLDISCGPGCAHCCHFLVEVVWDEAMTIANKIISLPKNKRDALVKSLKASAKLKRKFFGEKSPYRKATRTSKEIPNKYFDKFFLENKFPCPLLDKKTNMCSVYDVRPTSCRFHMVTSPSENCMPKNFHNDDYEVPEELENTKQRLEDEILSFQEDERWGELSIVVTEALEELTQR